MIGSGRQTMKIEGLDALIETLRSLPPNVSAKLIKPAMQHAGDLLRSQLQWQAYKQLQEAEGRGYKRKKPGPHLWTTTATRAKTYRKGETTYVAVGFSYQAGGSHAHLIELGHRIVKGGTLAKGTSPGGITAAGKRLLANTGWQQGNWETGRKILRGRRKGKPEIGKGNWRNIWTGTISKMAGALAPTGQRIRGGGHLTGGVTRKFPMLQPAFEAMKRPMMIGIENELKKIEGEAQRLAKNPQKRQWLDNTVI